jgi:pimeloyl-ACP methyl ester carboxylesterase
MGSRRTAIVEWGAGAPLVIVPGIQGRWEYVRPAIDALARSFRVVSFPLAGERPAAPPFDPRRGLDNYVDQIAGALDDAGIDRAIVCGISFGGLAALRFAAAHPARTSALVLASTPGPRWRLRPRHERYARLPRLCGPVFLLETPWRLRDEIRAAFPDRRSRWRFGRSQLKALLDAPVSVTAMAARALMIESVDHAAVCPRIVVPTLVVTGEPRLDHVVPVDGSADYARLIAGAERAIIGGTGHLGTITRPDAFAAIVRAFVARRECDIEPPRARFEVA